jgi:hypothetical protein
MSQNVTGYLQGFDSFVITLFSSLCHIFSTIFTVKVCLFPARRFTIPVIDISSGAVSGIFLVLITSAASDHTLLCITRSIKQPYQMYNVQVPEVKKYFIVSGRKINHTKYLSFRVDCFCIFIKYKIMKMQFVAI